MDQIKEIVKTKQNDLNATMRMLLAGLLKEQPKHGHRSI